MIYNYWNEDTVREEALKYVKRSDFKKLSPGAYEKSKLLNIFEDVCKHMPVPFKWTIDLLKKEALKYNTLTEFTKNSLIAYNRAKKINILDDICKHMIISKFNKWDYDNMLNEALKYNNRQDFRERSRVAYEKAQKINILDDICSHMTNNENRLKDRIIYAYEFSDNFVYIGLTYNIKKRDNDRKRNNKDSVTEHINKTGLTPVIKILTPFIPIEDAKKEENNYIDKYKINGWYILNKTKGGSIGATKMLYNREDIKKEALKYNKKTDFINMSHSYYRSAIKLNILDDVCKHMTTLNYWNIENIKKEALKYTNRNMFQCGSRGAYSAARRRNILDEVCIHMTSRIKWTEETIFKESLKYSNKTEFRKNSRVAYEKAYRMNILKYMYK